VISLLIVLRTYRATVISVIETESDSVEKYQELCNIKLMFRVYPSGQVKDDEVGRACSMNGGEEECI
jgi:hypothetical protein